MLAMASPFKIPEDPQASAELDKDAPQNEEPPGYRSLHYPPHLTWQGHSPHINKYQTHNTH